jgi:hypothetical protein
MPTDIRTTLGVIEAMSNQILMMLEQLENRVAQAYPNDDMLIHLSTIERGYREAERRMSSLITDIDEWRT